MPAVEDPRYSGPALLVLADGRVFRGAAFGATKTVVGEIVFNTTLSGYQEVLSDPSYAGQVVCFTATEIGNVGTNPEDDESNNLGAEGIIVRSLSPISSNWRSEESLTDYLKRREMPGIAEIDTRALTRHLREAGSMMGALSTDTQDVEALLKLAKEAAPMEGRNLVREVSTSSVYEWDEASWGNENPPPVKYKVVAYDFGIKRNILRRLRDRGIQTTVVPASTPVSEVLAKKPDGIFLSNGPGDPAAVPEVIDEVGKLLKSEKHLPVFGICLGHQIMCLALGGKTYKLKFGHHGGNHPVQDKRDASVAITAQNHGFAVDIESLQGEAELTHVNLFDNTLAGFRMKESPVQGVQFHPEASPGPHDSEVFFMEFVDRLAEAHA